ncbi:MAG: hypothetical protein ACTSX4_09440 [Candidatus Helarchaeota archaeon]
MSVTVKAPNPDDIFDKWLQRAPLKKLEKYFRVKGVKFEKSNISKAKHVKNILESVIFYFKTKIEKMPQISRKIEEYTVFPSNIKKIKFYDFGESKVNPKTWQKKENVVPFLNTLKKVPCDNKKCTNGYISCPSCKGEGRIHCRKCKGKGSFPCKRCGGTGIEEIEIKVLKVIKDKETEIKKTVKHQCPICYGTGTEFCRDCHGTGFEICNKCKGEKRTPCKSCAGYGFFYEYRIMPVPFGVPAGPDKFEHYLFFNKDIEKAIKEELAEEINQATVQGIKITNLKDLEEKFIKANLGTFDKEISARRKDCQKTWKKLENSGLEKPLFPIYMFPTLQMDVITPSNKKFSIFSIGTDRGYAIYAPRFK